MVYYTFGECGSSYVDRDKPLKVKQMEIINIKLKKNPYKLHIGYNSFKKLPLLLKDLKLGNFGLVITSPKILTAHKKKIKSVLRGKNYKIITVADGEKAKSKKSLSKVIEEIIKVDTLNRKVFIICLGGGTVGDLGGFSASIYKRGIPYIQVPTTLLAQIDSSIGGKTAIDLKEAKNILGSFYQPKAVIIDPDFLSTLPNKEIKQGLAEAIKYGIIKNKDFFYFLANNSQKILNLDPIAILKVISVCAKIKATIVAADEKEDKGLRTILNFGHTLAHALESSSQYKKLSHGNAVSLGMLYAAQLSQTLGKCPQDDLEQVTNILKLFSLPTKIKFIFINLYKPLTYDKKFISGKIRMVLLNKIGQVEVVEGISPQKIKKTLKMFTID